MQRVLKDGVEKIYNLFPDHLGSTRVVAANNHSTVSYLSYYPFGKTKSDTNTITSVKNRYTGQEQDSEVDLYYYNARYYNPTSGHFISADKAEGPNRYSYVANNPIMRNDPSGNMVSDDSQGAGAYGSGSYMGMLGSVMREMDPKERREMQLAVIGTLTVIPAASMAIGGLIKAGSALVPAGIGASQAVKEGFFKLFGNEELLPAMRFYRQGDYDKAFSEAGNIMRKFKPNFDFEFGFFDDLEVGATTDFMGNIQLSAAKIDNLKFLASKGIHEVSHGIDFTAGRAFIKGLTTEEVLRGSPLFSKLKLATEFKANLAQYTAGAKTLREAASDVVYSATRGTSKSIWQLLTDAVK